MLFPQIKGKGFHLQFIKHNLNFAMSSTLEMNSSLDYLCLFIFKGSHFFAIKDWQNLKTKSTPDSYFLHMCASESHCVKERYHFPHIHAPERKLERKNKERKRLFSFLVKLHTTPGVFGKKCWLHRCYLSSDSLQLSITSPVLFQNRFRDLKEQLDKREGQLFIYLLKGHFSQTLTKPHPLLSLWADSWKQY